MRHSKGGTLFLWLIPLLLAALAAALVFRSSREEPTTFCFPNVVDFQSAMAEQNAQFIAELQQVLDSRSDSHTQISGPDGGNILVTNWRDIAAVYITQAKSPALDTTLLEQIFRDMVTVTYTETTALYPHTELYPSADGTLREVEVNTPELMISAEVTCKYTDTVDSKYAARLDALLGRSLALPNSESMGLAALPPLRCGMVRAAYALVDKVSYFWGGKSDTSGWEPLWGAPAVVTSAGNSSSGTVRLLGLDCSGLVSWAAVTAAGDPAAYALIGDGVRDQFKHCTPIAWEDVQPGDLLFFPDYSHVGIAIGFDADRRLQVVHCSSTLGGVVLSEDAATIGFTVAGQPEFYKNK